MFDFTFDTSLTNAEIMGLNECFKPKRKDYKRGERITTCSQLYDTIGIIKKGIAYLSTLNADTQGRIIDYYEEGDMFGRHFPPVADDKEFYIVAKTGCVVDWIEYKKVIHCCEKACPAHALLIDKLITKNMRKNMLHLDILGQRSLRAKLLTYFEYISAQKKRKKFTIPMPYSDLADYLAADRSALMRELKSLCDEGVIQSQKREIILTHIF